MSTINNRINIFIPLLGSLLLLACNKDKTLTGQGSANAGRDMAPGEIILTDEQISANDFATGRFETKTFHQSVRATGMLDVPPEGKVAISAYFGGYVKELPLLSGQYVKKGQTLMVLENPAFIQLQEDLLEAKGQLAYLESDYRRQKGLAQSKVASEKKFLKAEADYQVMRARYEALRKKLHLLGIQADQMEPGDITPIIHVKAPISGTVTAIHAQRGMFLEPSDVALELVNTGGLHLELRVFEKDAWKIKEGQQVVFNLQDNPSKEYFGKVQLVGKSVDLDERSIGLHVHFKPSEEVAGWMPGMYVEAAIQTASVQEAGLPEEAIVRSGNLHYVLMQTERTPGERRFIRKRVVTGNTEEGYLEIKNSRDFAENAVFLTSGAFNLIAE
ncbi:efflux RND transporter periplasmic adaptor subunit [Echinicola strongylocentroti]|uniref:Efflux RND transporter periplasmic adaptor subunit n=1 Tax=Echinicola strongylocentroti TaxID=1795355 RepID=A0A2Z4IJW8_9BACT|nr:efflux RND transporter periplasmic adaptor subunit [Echinicola strongylocentroti]AWW30989.1 efflux RND transporter periplasmic adaptor subunit [Echinicola strongylocentroti]